MADKGNTTLMPDGGYALSGIWFCVRWKVLGFGYASPNESMVSMRHRFS
ncbi:hypothetical protein IVW58_04605 [Salmonella enterica subsp. enterica serovar Worthington]|nr:hypothetical protein [Salmonella enterica subsp. enterica serovar Worthington]MBP1524368.1 hypothetical protein [Salmonella enterica subsp. enterica serovar Worthington]